MQPYPQNALSPQPRVFHYSLDWRFLLPMADLQKIYLLLEGDRDLTQALAQVGIPVSQQLSFADLRRNKKTDIQSFVMPFGSPVSWTGAKHEDQVEFYFSLRQLLPPGGYLLVGFNNVWNLRANPQKKYYACTPRRMTDQLKQSGFQFIQIFGAMPTLAIPEYIFDLNSRTIQFTLQNRFRRKPAVLRSLRLLSEILGWKRISNFLPCYFAVATA
jgi:hypothetical protein